VDEVVRADHTLAFDHNHAPSQLPRARTKTKQVNTPSFDVRAALFGVFGIDLPQTHGLGPSLSLKLVGECGTDLRAWQGARHFTSWLWLAPGNKVSPLSGIFQMPTPARNAEKETPRHTSGVECLGRYASPVICR